MTNMVLMCLLPMEWLVPAIIQMAQWSLTSPRVLQSCCVTNEKRYTSCSRLTLTLVLQLNTSFWSINHFDEYFYSSCDAYTTSEDLESLNRLATCSEVSAGLVTY